MTNVTPRSDIVIPDVAEFYTHSKVARREAEIARAAYLHGMFASAFRKVRTVLRRWAEILHFAPKVNQDARS